jgi:hypothetical protein
MANQKKVAVESSKKAKQASATDFVKAGRTEKSLQEWLDKTVIANEKGEVKMAKAFEAGKAELIRLRVIKATLQERNLRPVSDYSALQFLYEHELSGITPETLAVQNEALAEKKKGRFMGDLSAEAEAVIDRHFELNAIAEYQTVQQIKRVLDLQVYGRVEATATVEAVSATV